MERKLKTVILGGGISGLLLAKFLSDENNDVCLLEEEEYINYESFTNFAPVDKFGYQSLYLSDSTDIQFAREKLLYNLNRHIQKKHVLIDGVIYNYPLKLADIFKNTNLRFITTAVINYLKGILSFTSPENYEDQVIKYYGRTLYEFYFIKYLEKEFAHFPINQIDIELAKNRIHYVSLTNMLRNVLRNSVENKYTSEYHYFPGDGIKDYLLKLRKSIEQNKGKIYKDVTFNNIERNHQKELNINFSYQGQNVEITANKIYSTISITDLYNLVPGNAEYNSSLKWSPEFLVYLKIMHPSKKFPDGVFYTADKSVSFFQLSKLSDTPELKENECICSLTINQKLIEKELLIETLSKELMKIGFTDKDSVVLDSRIVLKKEEKPIPHLGYKNEYEYLSKAINEFGDIILFGDRAGFSEFSFEKNIKEMQKISNNGNKAQKSNINSRSEYVELPQSEGFRVL